MRGEGRDHGGLGLRGRGEGIGLRMQAWLKKEDEYDTKINKKTIEARCVGNRFTMSFGHNRNEDVCA